MDAGMAPTYRYEPLLGYRVVTLGQKIGNQRSMRVVGGASGGRFFITERRAMRTKIGARGRRVSRWLSTEARC